MKRNLVALVLAAALSGCGGGDDNHGIEYVVTGSTSRASLTYATADGGTAQQTVSLPKTISIGEVSKGGFLYISAQNENSSGSVTVTIKVDGNNWKSTTSSGAFVIATASGSCC